MENKSFTKPFKIPSKLLRQFCLRHNNQVFSLYFHACEHEIIGQQRHQEKWRKRSITYERQKPLPSFFTFKTFLLAFSLVASNWGKLVARTGKPPISSATYWTVYKMVKEEVELKLAEEEKQVEHGNLTCKSAPLPMLAGSSKWAVAANFRSLVAYA